MEINKQSQQAGDNSNLQQADVINNYTIQFDEGKCREVCKSYFEMAQLNIAFAMDLAQKREMAFEDAVVNRLQKVENSMEAFRDPAFLKSLKKAQEVAICTDEKSEYDLLSELLVNRFEVRSEKQQSLYVNKAIEMVDEIPEDVLMGLTMMHVFAGTSICSTDHYNVRWMLAHCYQQILTGGRLPEGSEWVEALDMLSLGRVSHSEKFVDSIDALSGRYDKLLVAGVKRGTDEYRKSVDILCACGLDESVFNENPILKDHVLLLVDQFQDEYMLYKRTQPDGGYTRCLNKEQLACLGQIVGSLYDESPITRDLAKANLRRFMREDETIRQVMDWWDSIPVYFSTAPAARILANANARRLCADIPVINIKRNKV